MTTVNLNQILNDSVEAAVVCVMGTNTADSYRSMYNKILTYINNSNIYTFNTEYNKLYDYIVESEGNKDRTAIKQELVYNLVIALKWELYIRGVSESEIEDMCKMSIISDDNLPLEITNTLVYSSGGRDIMKYMYIYKMYIHLLLK